MNKQDCIDKLEEIKAQLNRLEQQIARRVKKEETRLGAVITKENNEIGKKLAQLELAKAREKIRRYQVS
ncbi:hypothetical protein MHB50_08260 [Siminovitchia sp. FSL H7-0308]|uniref:hypothetical protein n=1 Tax=unclassified Siminovitchia TaxID=2837530 RepID=UPI0030CC0D2C